MTVSLQTAWETQIAAGEPAATIKLQNLQVIVKGPEDSWGRVNQPLPALVSAEISKATTFSDSAAGDSVCSDTVHYGILSKHLQKIFSNFETRPEGWQLSDLLEAVWAQLTGFQLIQTESPEPASQAFLESSSFQHLKVTIHLPKASLLGNGVSLTGSASMTGGAPQSRARVLRIHDLRIPTLIGVNEHEKKQRQIVIANVEVEKWAAREDGYGQLEAVITKTMSDSSLETLEALVDVIATQITKHLNTTYPSEAANGWKLKISLDKPVAVPFADAPCVEIRVDTRNVRTL
ncbi:unnamed protein product [Clonostachys byssicola]|uniref:Dihydroneopterin aldolase/epimerase domain-containing protein n=1 Tax=Clonostachys byssicola TaxID=160290 RepID=A0A9N9U3X8_9HYPO|nr:unnamed protein product [Clonostachys byssicola]